MQIVGPIDERCFGTVANNGVESQLNRPEQPIPFDGASHQTTLFATQKQNNTSRSGLRLREMACSNTSTWEAKPRVRCTSRLSCFRKGPPGNSDPNRPSTGKVEYKPSHALVFFSKSLDREAYPVWRADRPSGLLEARDSLERYDNGMNCSTAYQLRQKVCSKPLGQNFQRPTTAFRINDCAYSPSEILTVCVQQQR